MTRTPQFLNVNLQNMNLKPNRFTLSFDGELTLTNAARDDVERMSPHGKHCTVDLKLNLETRLFTNRYLIAGGPKAKTPLSRRDLASLAIIDAETSWMQWQPARIVFFNEGIFVIGKHTQTADDLAKTLGISESDLLTSGTVTITPDGVRLGGVDDTVGFMTDAYRCPSHLVARMFMLSVLSPEFED
jgi:hypothetical protein